MPAFDKVRGSVEKTLDGLGNRQKALATQSLDYLQKIIHAASEFEIGSPAVNDAKRGHEQLTISLHRAQYVEYTAAVQRSLAS